MVTEGIQTVAVLGLDLMGGSLCLALRRRGFAGRIRVYARREEALERAREMGCCDEAFTEAYSPESTR